MSYVALPVPTVAAVAVVVVVTEVDCDVLLSSCLEDIAVVFSVVEFSSDPAVVSAVVSVVVSDSFVVVRSAESV